MVNLQIVMNKSDSRSNLEFTESTNNWGNKNTIIYSIIRYFSTAFISNEIPQQMKNRFILNFYQIRNIGEIARKSTQPEWMLLFARICIDQCD